MTEAREIGGRGLQTAVSMLPQEVLLGAHTAGQRETSFTTSQDIKEWLRMADSRQMTHGVGCCTTAALDRQWGGLMHQGQRQFGCQGRESRPTAENPLPTSSPGALSAIGPIDGSLGPYGASIVANVAGGAAYMFSGVRDAPQSEDQRTSAFKPTAAALQRRLAVAVHAEAYTPQPPVRSEPTDTLRSAPPAARGPSAGTHELAHQPPKCRVSLTFDKPSKAKPQQQQINITASSASCGINGLLEAITYLGMQEEAAKQPVIRCCPNSSPVAAQAQSGTVSPFAPASPRPSLHRPTPLSPRRSRPGSIPASPPRQSAPVSCASSWCSQSTAFLTGCSSPPLSTAGQLTPPGTPPRAPHSPRKAARSPTKGVPRTLAALRSPVRGRVVKAKSPTRQPHLSSVSVSSGSDAPHMAAWTEQDKQQLLQVVTEMQPHGAVEWELVAARVGRCSKGGASAERMFRTLTDPGYQKSVNKHGCRLNPRNGTAMHIMVEYALARLPGLQGTIDDIARVIEANPEFQAELDYSARPGTKIYPRWKDTLLSCFKAGRYAHLQNTHTKVNGKTLYRMIGANP